MKNIVCYDLRSFFKSSPTLSCCPLCGKTVERASLPPSSFSQEFRSTASFPVVETILYFCKGCRWWAIREQHTDCELVDGCADLFLTEDLEIPKASLEIKLSFDENATWILELLKDVSLWEKRLLLNARHAQLLFGK